MTDIDINVLDVDKVCEIYLGKNCRELKLTDDDLAWIMMYADNMKSRIKAYIDDISVIAGLVQFAERTCHTGVTTKSDICDVLPNLRTLYTKTEDRMLQGGNCSID